jgi:transaldolase
VTDSPLHRLAEQGQSVWIDYLSRDFLRPDGLERMVREDALVGVTSNPTIFQKAVAGSDSYDEQLREVGDTGAGPKEVFYALAVRDVVDACDVLRPVWEGGSGGDGFVSLEVDPHLAYDVEGTVAEALDLHQRVDRPNLLVKIPATKPGLAAIEDVVAHGRSVNVTLCFSLRRHGEVAESYVRGLERLVAAGGDPASVASVASFFVSRVDTETDRRLDELGRDDLRGRLAVANAKLAYQTYRRVFSGERWAFLESKGASPQRCLWASTSTKDPSYSDVKYVEELIGPRTVNTMPEETLRAFADHGTVAPTLERDLDQARRVLEEVAAAGVDYDDVTDVLEAEGVRKFADSFDQLLEDIRAKSGQLSRA